MTNKIINNKEESDKYKTILTRSFNNSFSITYDDIKNAYYYDIYKMLKSEKPFNLNKMVTYLVDHNIIDLITDENTVDKNIINESNHDFYNKKTAKEIVSKLVEEINDDVSETMNERELKDTETFNIILATRIKKILYHDLKEVDIIKNDKDEKLSLVPQLIKSTTTEYLENQFLKQGFLETYQSMVDYDIDIDVDETENIKKLYSDDTDLTYLYKQVIKQELPTYETGLLLVNYTFNQLLDELINLIPCATVQNHIKLVSDLNLKLAIQDFKLKPNNTGKQLAVAKAIDESNHDYFCIDKEIDGKTEREFYYFDGKNTIQENRINFQQFLEKTGGCRINANPKYLENIMNAISNFREINNNFIECENYFIDKNNFEYYSKDELNIVTDDIVGVEKPSGDIDRLVYYPHLTFKNYDKNVEQESISVRAMKNGFIPANNQDYTNIYEYMIYKIGLCAIGYNINKEITNFYSTSPNTFKSTFLDLLKSMFNGNVSEIDTNKLQKDNFIIETIKEGKHGIFNEELQTDDFIKNESSNKKLSGGHGISSRGLYTAKNRKVKRVAPYFTAFNPKKNKFPVLPIDDEAYMYRLTFIKMPNTFKSTEDKENNILKSNPNISNLIHEDTRGLSELFSMGINAIKTLDLTKDIQKQLPYQQSYEEKVDLMMNNNILLKYITIRIKQIDTTNISDENEGLTTDLIIQDYYSYYKEKYGTIAPEKSMNETKFKKEIGTALKQRFNNLEKKKETGTGKTRYINLTFRNTSPDVKTDYDLKIIANTIDISIAHLSEMEQYIYTRIKNNELNSINALLKDLKQEYTEREIVDAVKTLETYDYITITNNIDTF